MIQLNIALEPSSRQSSFGLTVDTVIQSSVITRILGPSGVGKTTLLKILAGLIVPHRGKIIVDDTCWLDSDLNYNRPVQERKVGFVFQDYALFPNMTVRQHLLYGTGDTAYIARLLEIGELATFAQRYPRQLSGGQRQRLAILRALSTRPRLLLMDEPFSALDDGLKKRLIGKLDLLFKEQGTTVVIVTHSKNEFENENIHTLTLYSQEG